MAAHERRARKLAGKLIQPLYGMVWFFPLGADRRVAPLGFEIKNPVRLDQINRPIRKALEEQMQMPDIGELGFEERLGLLLDREVMKKKFLN